MQVDQIPIDSIKRYEGNPRINDHAVKAVVRSIKDFGWRQPVVLDKHMVIVIGDTRYLAAVKMGDATVPCHIAKNLSAAKAKALRLADNKVGELSDWDDELLKLEMADLDGLDFDMAATGFSDAEVAKILRANNIGQTGADDVPDPPKKAIAQRGDVWTLGEHRLMCGDSTDIDDVLHLMDGQTAALFHTDPPYVVDYDSRLVPNQDVRQNKWEGIYHEVREKDADAFFTSVFNNAIEVLALNAAWYCWHASKRYSLIERPWQQLDVIPHQQIIWVKPSATWGYSMWRWQHEPCLMGWRQGHKPDVNVETQLGTTVWEIDWEGSGRSPGKEHPTQKPVAIFDLPINAHTDIGAICYEPFGGSGSQMISAEGLNRRCYMMELEPRFCDAIVKRWQTFTGSKATRIKAKKGTAEAVPVVPA